MSDSPVFETVHKSAGCSTDIVFVHGLTGDARSTWTASGSDEFWPEWLKDDFTSISLYTLGYPASLFEKWAKKEMDMFERAAFVLELFAAKELGKRPLVFIAHSLGGLLVKMILRKATEAEDNDWVAIAESTELVHFLSTPHNGASLANALNILPGTSRHIKLLTNDTGFLEDLNQSYRGLVSTSENLKTVVYYEKHKTKKIAVVVDRQSADPGVAGTHPVAFDKDHINICKPASRDDEVFLGICRHLRKVINKAQADHDPLVEGYEEKSQTDRRDLLEKLIDAEREHEYSFANNAQNRFARRYTKTGLLAAAKDDHDRFLSEIQTRFITQIYHPLICKYADDSEITEALQNQVIGPLTNKLVGGTKFDAATVLNGLYYLTEQCHIRWDPETAENKGT